MSKTQRSIGVAALVVLGVLGTAWAVERVHDVIASVQVQPGDVDILIAPATLMPPPEAPTADSGYDEIRGGLTLTRE